MSILSAEFDPAPLQAWLMREIGIAGPIHLKRIAGGQSNPTYFVEGATQHCVLRKKPPGVLLPSAHAIDREFRIQRALSDTKVPVAKMIAYCDDVSVIGTPFYLMERLYGRVFTNYRLNEIPASEKRAYFEEFARVLAHFHHVDYVARGLGDFGKTGNYFSRQITRWSAQWHASKLTESDDINTLIEWLPAHLPNADSTQLVHGDFRFGNVMWHPSAPKIVGVLDWELATLGHPLADVAYASFAWELAPTVYSGLRGENLTALALPERRAFVQMYQSAYGPAFGEVLPFHYIFSMFRFAVILEGVRARARQGAASSQDAEAVGALAHAFARRAVELTRDGL